MEQSQSSAIKLLVDALSKSLQNLSDKINSYQSILTHIDNCEDKELLQINDILNYCNNLSKTLDNTASDFYEKFNIITESVNTVKTRIEKVPENIKDEHSSILKKIDELESNIKKEITNCNNNILVLKTDIEPISKLSELINKPLGFLIFIIGLILASITIANGLSDVSNWIKSSKENVKTYIQSAPPVDTIK